MMGGGGVPSESGLMRAWKTAEAAAMFPDARVIVAMPIEASDTADHGIEHELALHGVDMSRIERESRGRNTREQAVEIHRMLAGSGDSLDMTIGLVTSPEHMRRTWRSFEKAGFKQLAAFPSWSESISADLRYGNSKIANGKLANTVGGSMTLRYRFWDNLIILIKCAREAVAMIYYHVLDWA